MPEQLPQVTLHAADYAVITLYLLGVTAVGWYFRKFARKDLANYFLAGRRLPGWLNGVSNAVTCVNADVAPRLAALGAGPLGARAAELADRAGAARGAVRGFANKLLTFDVLLDALAGE